MSKQESLNIRDEPILKSSNLGLIKKMKGLFKSSLPNIKSTAALLRQQKFPIESNRVLETGLDLIKKMAGGNLTIIGQLFSTKNWYHLECIYSRHPLKF